MQHYVIKFVSDLRQVGGFSLSTPVSSTNKTEILLKVVLSTITNPPSSSKHLRIPMQVPNVTGIQNVIRNFNWDFFLKMSSMATLRYLEIQLFHVSVSYSDVRYSQWT
jgi:hypothetical protein